MCTRKYCYLGGEGASLGLLKLRLFVAKLQRSIALLSPVTNTDSTGDDDMFEALSLVPEDVGEGHFAVLAVMDSESKRFVVEIERLSSPEFARLLDRAEEEYGFDQTGAISLPCCPEEFQKLLDRSF